MNHKTKISTIVFIQILFIVSSFLTVAILESQISLVGNSVNIAGKNRLLTSQFLNELKDFTYVKNSNAIPELKLNQIEENILLLKNGGFDNNLKIQKIDEKFINEWDVVYQHFSILKLNYEKSIENSEGIVSTNDMSEIENNASLLIYYSDVLVDNLGTSINKTSQNMILLQLFLLIVNVGVHIALLLVVFRILQKTFEENLRIEKLAIVGELSSRLAHDMRNPLSNINMSTQLLKSTTSEENAVKKLDAIEKGVARLSHQINDVMDFVRTKEPELKLWDLNSILDDCFNRFKLSNSVKVILPEKSTLIKCDKSQSEILFINLISNALDAIQNEGSIEVRVKANSNKTIIEIIDSGTGIPEEKIKTIFEPLVTFKENGTGLGLASCKNIVENHRGSITAKNNPTEFIITLPNH
ncbi:MAG: HAMP domain-containing histidine kinase [Nitrosopumilus sp.]|nr:HAMP domain-containing histidine kinase [Nitrosopumilus sp.]MBL7018073.1 HAMP domain-containing histidine kinase [Nitrosopumilus sp.]